MNGVSSTHRRYLAIVFPRLATDRLRRRASVLNGCQIPSAASDDPPLVVTHKEKGALVLCAMDEAASRAGLSIGMTLATARALHPALTVAEKDWAADRILLEHIADWAERYTPCIGLMRPDGLALDITGAAHLLGGEAALLADITTHLTRQGFTLRAAIAGTAEAARAFARFGTGGVMPDNSEAADRLPLAAIEMEDSLITALARLGLKQIGDVARHPRAPLVARFGRELIDRIDRVRGLSETPISPRRPVPTYSAERRFAEPIGHEHDIHCTVLTLAADLARVLEKHGEGGRRFEVSFFRADGAMRRLAVETARPLRDPKGVMRLFRERLDSLADPLDPGFGFDVIRLAATQTEPQGAREPDFDGRDGWDEELAALIERLGIRLSPSRVMRLLPQNSHIPERAARLVPAHYGNNALAVDWSVWATPSAAPTRPIRLIEPAEPIDVIAEVPDGPPIRFRWRRVFHVVVQAEGPERIAAEWWRVTGGATPPTRDYFRIEDENGHRFWVFRAGLFVREPDEPRWFMHGLFG